MDNDMSSPDCEEIIAPDLPKNHKNLTEGQVDALLGAARKWFSCETTRTRVEACAVEAFNFLKKADHTMAHAANDIFVKKEPWLDFDARCSDDTPEAADLRRSLLRRNAFALGMAYMLFRMWQENLVGSSHDLKLFIDTGTNLEPMEITQELLFRQLVEPERYGFTLQDLLNKFLLSDNTNTDTIRNKWLVPLACLGVWAGGKIKPEDLRTANKVQPPTTAEDNAVPDGERRGRKRRSGEFSITVGIVPQIFQQRALLPYLAHLEVAAESKEQSLARDPSD